MAPRACPHLGADLATAAVECGTLVCPWHGLRLSDQSRGAWQPVSGPRRRCVVLGSPRRRRQEEPTDAPIIPARPPSPRLAAVTRLEGVCEPCDVVANRLDPWHGAWFHPYSFTRLEVLSSPAADEDLPDEFDRFVVAVTFRMGRLGVPVIAEFTTPDPRTVVMRSSTAKDRAASWKRTSRRRVSGRDGLPRTAVVEAVIAHSDRRHFGKALFVAPVIRPLMGSRRTAGGVTTSPTPSVFSS